MARSRKADTALVFLAVVVGIPLWLIQNHPWLAVALLLLVVGCAVAYSRSRSCGICGVALKRTVYRWEIDGSKASVCPNCNRTLEKRQSHRAMSAF